MRHVAPAQNQQQERTEARGGNGRRVSERARSQLASARRAAPGRLTERRSRGIRLTLAGASAPGGCCGVRPGRERPCSGPRSSPARSSQCSGRSRPRPRRRGVDSSRRRPWERRCCPPRRAARSGKVAGLRRGRRNEYGRQGPRRLSARMLASARWTSWSSRRARPRTRTIVSTACGRGSRTGEDGARRRRL
jgi:hypothetical protein